MSRLTLKDIPDIVATYEEDLAEYTTNLTITGKTLEKALKEQPVWSAYYGERLCELNIVVKYLETQVKATRGRLNIKYTEGYSRTLP